LPPLKPASYVPPATGAAVQAPAHLDLAKLTPDVRAVYLAAQRAAEWLSRSHLPTGRFAPGIRPDVNLPFDDSGFVNQALAAAALGESAKFFRDERMAARARQAVLLLLSDTGADPADPQARCCTLPPAVADPLAAAGMMLLAIHSLPQPEGTLLDQGEQLARYIARRQQPDGSLSVGVEGGIAAYALMRSQALRPAPWKTEVIRRAMGPARSAWATGQFPTLAAWQAATHAEAFLQSKDRQRDAAYAGFAFELCDWLAGQQYASGVPLHWAGGFPTFTDGKPVPTAPRADSVLYLLGLLEGKRATRQAPDVDRHARYSGCMQRGLVFAVSLQYTDANCQHFAAAFRPAVVGSLHGSHLDGSARSEDTAAAVLVMVRYLSGLADLDGTAP
jgi:hypothetical protein